MKINDKLQCILPLSSPDATLDKAGGKGANLARLARAGLPVPDGFFVTTTAYQDFVAANHLELILPKAISPNAGETLTDWESASQVIRKQFADGAIPPDVEHEIRIAYRQMGTGPVAVRSSATAEDLPGISFAGQQDTFLNVVDEDQLMVAVIDCWSSLWTARAIEYRVHNRILHSSAALAVVVQVMVDSQVSGVMFTANPLTGLRSEIVIEATLGLGEALVSGKVEPDHYTIDTTSWKITAKVLGKKAISIRNLTGGGTVVVAEHAETQQALTDEAIQELARLGQQVAALYTFPQDIEFAYLDGFHFLLQSRPITTLFPLPDGLPADPLQVMASFAAIQGMLDPLTPIGRETFMMVFATGAGLFGSHVTLETQRIILSSGERLWINITAPIRNSVGRRIARGALGYVEPSIRRILDSILEDPRLQPDRTGLSFKTIRRLAGFFVPVAGCVLRNLVSPERRRLAIVRQGDDILDFIRTRAGKLAGDRYAQLVHLIDLMEDGVHQKLPQAFIQFVSGMVAGMVSFAGLNHLVDSLPIETGGKNLVLEMTRGISHNPTTEMDLTLWETAQAIRNDPHSLEIFQNCTAFELAQTYLSGDLPSVAQEHVKRFLDRYGLRGLAEIDLGRERWVDDPTHVFEALGSYLRIETLEQSPDMVFARSLASAEDAFKQLCAKLRRTPLGGLKVLQARFLNSRMRGLMGLRESPKFFVVSLFGLIRQQLIRVGQEFVNAGELIAPDDLVYLTYAELRRFAARQPSDWKTLVAKRREAYTWEKQRRQIPRLLLSDGRVFFEGLSAQTGAEGLRFTGSPVSPGSVEGKVRIVLDPRQANLFPGEILVCPGTDPSWTPLFLSAAGLVMEVGGMMTHGAVVAREYGIPAVVGIDRATSRLHTGQRIRVDGSTGVISLID